MDDDRYLWDKTGPADPEIASLEQALAPLRRLPPPPKLPARRRRLWGLAVAAALLVAVAAAVIVARGSRQPWQLQRLAGAPAVGSATVADTRSVRPGDVIETDASSSARLRVGMIGEVEVRAGSRVRLLETRATDHRLALDRGAIAARIWAPPRLFFVETPSGLAVDLGCAYTLEVAPDGGSLLAVTAGWVQLEDGEREALVPAGSLCATRPGIGPGTPYREGASPAFVAALRRFDFEKGGTEALPMVLEAADAADSLTLWHLLRRTREDDRGHVYDRLATLVPPPPTVTRAGILAGDERMLEAWRSELGIPWFRKDGGWLRRAIGAVERAIS
jgi:ferric-dicitrate binding protein FerR (iron transport regulator)